MVVRNAGITAFVFWTVMLGTTVPTPLYPLYEQAFGIVPVEVTVLFVMYAIGAVIALLTLGWLSDHIGRRLVLGIAQAPPGGRLRGARRAHLGQRHPARRRAGP